MEHLSGAAFKENSASSHASRRCRIRVAVSGEISDGSEVNDDISTPNTGVSSSLKLQVYSKDVSRRRSQILHVAADIVEQS